MSPLDLTTVYRSAHRRDCNERLLVLTAVGIEAFIASLPGEYFLQVPEADAGYALRQLAQYEAENRAPPPPRPPRQLHRRAWTGCLGYAMTLLSVAWMVSGGAVRLDAFELGELDAARAQAGECWRAWTALTLHLDGPHLAANLCAGVWFGYLAGRQIGSGTAWLLGVTGAGLANLIEALLAPPEHRAVGASTAVFSILGMMSAYSWRERFALRERWARRWGPLIAGVILLGWTGTAGEDTDVMAHLSGFAVGALFGSGASLPRARRLLERVPQSLSGAAALGSLAIAWAVALAH